MTSVVGSHALPESQIVWFCDECRTYTLEREGLCPLGCEGYITGWQKRQRKRRGYICPDCDEETNLYLSKQNFMGHNELPQWER